MSYIQNEISILATSDPVAGARNVSPDGSSFEILLEDALRVPKDAINCTVEVQEATIWWVVPNIITGINDRFFLTRAADPNSPYAITLDQGLYDLTGLNNAINNKLTNAGAPTSPASLITLLADDATQKVIIRVNYIGVSIDFTQAQTFRDILGFNSQVLGPTVAATTNFLAPNVAAFNTVNYFLIHSDLVSKGIRFNNTFNQTIAQVLINVAPGSQIVSTPFNPARSNGNDLIGAARTNIRFQLTDDSNRPVDTNGEAWTARVVIRYSVPTHLSFL